MSIILAIIGILLFNLIIFVHELGHFFWAKKFGVKVNEFALGMGPKILKFQKGETLFSLRAFPIGGFCEMEGEDDKSDDPNSFGNKAAWKRFIIIAFGAIMNFILGLIMTAALLIQNPYFTSTKVAKFANEATSCFTGLAVGDEIIKVDDIKVYTYKDLAFNLSADGKEKFNITVKRNDQIIELENVTFKTETNDVGKPVTILDFKLQPIEKNFWTLLKQTWFDTLSTIKVVWLSLVGIITGRFSINNMSGPIGIASIAGKVTNEGLKTGFLVAFNNILSLMAMITINLGVINLLPLPALDGGRLIFLLIEIIIRKKINPKYENWIHALGFFLFLAFTIYISYSDILRLLGKI